MLSLVLRTKGCFELRSCILIFISFDKQLEAYATVLYVRICVAY